MADYTDICIKKISDAGFEPHQDWQLRPTVSVSENGKTYRLPLDPPKSCAVYQIDGEIIVAGAKCDKLVVVSPNLSGATIFVELKGKDISHAIEQLEATLNHHLFNHKPQTGNIVRARIVTGGCGPASSSAKTLTDAKIRFLKKYKCDLRVLKNKQPDLKI